MNGAQCAPVCCKYPKDAADLAKGYTTETVAAGNCTMRNGTVEETGCAVKPRPAQPATPIPSKLTRPGTRPAPGPAPAPRPGTTPRPAPKPGQLTRPGR